MGADENIKTIQGIYEAFGRGDVQTVLEGVTDDVDWATETSSTAAPWYGVRHGKDGVAAFFEAFGSTWKSRSSTRTRSLRMTLRSIPSCTVEPLHGPLARRSTTICTTISGSRTERSPSIVVRRTPPRLWQR